MVKERLVTTPQSVSLHAVAREPLQLPPHAIRTSPAVRHLIIDIRLKHTSPSRHRFAFLAGTFLTRQLFTEGTNKFKPTQPKWRCFPTGACNLCWPPARQQLFLRLPRCCVCRERAIDFSALQTRSGSPPALYCLVIPSKDLNYYFNYRPIARCSS